jgi:hypothetical protein
MATSFTQLPATMNISMIAGDELEISLDTDISLVNYTNIVAIVYTKKVFASGNGGAGAVETIGDTAATFTVTVTNAASGQLTLGLPESATVDLSTSVEYRWFLRWDAPGLVRRTVVSGTFTLSNP